MSEVAPNRRHNNQSNSNSNSSKGNNHNYNHDNRIHGKPPVQSSKRRRKRSRKSNNYCGCGRIGFMASTVICFMTVYGIFMAISILYGVRHKRVFVKHAGYSKKEQRDYLQRQQQKKLARQFMQRSSKAGNNNYKEDMKTLEKFRREKKLQEIASFRPKYPKKIHFLHIHKSAGTAFCKQAYYNKMAADYEKNCNVRDDQRCCWYDSERESWNQKMDLSNETNETKLVEDSIRFAKKAPFDFVATERELAGPMLVDHYDYVISLRDSRMRYMSHWQHLKRDAQHRSRSSSSSRSGRKGIPISGQENIQHISGQENLQNVHESNVLTLVDPATGIVHPVGNFTKWISGQPDNYSLRMICGTPCVNISKYQITKELFEHSLERLWMNFSHILFVENMEESYARFATSYGWQPVMKTELQIKRKSHKKLNPNLNASLYADPLLTALDDALYEFAQRKYNLTNNMNNMTWTNDYETFQNQDLVDLYFSEGPSKNCTNPCCGYCSKW